MSRQYVSQLQLEIKPSQFYRYLVLILSSFILSSIMIIDINPFTIKLVLILVFITALIYALNNNRALYLLYQADGSWLVSRPGFSSGDFSNESQYFRARLCEGSVVTVFLAVLNFKLENGRFQNIVLFKDSLDEEAFRKLRVKLKVEGIHTPDHDKL